MIANIIRNAKKTVTGGDPYYSAVSLLLSMDGTNGSTTFTDSSLNALTVNAVGNAQISTTQSKYGGASGYFDGNGDYLSLGTQSQLDFGTGDFTIECWFQLTSTTNADQGILNDTRATFGTGSVLFKARQASGAGKICFQAYDFSSVGGRIVQSTTVPAINTWYHVALVRSSGAVRLFVNGVLESSGTWAGSVNFNYNNGTRIGHSILDGANGHFTGYLDDLRISRFARYVFNFTPPTAALPTTASSTPADPYYGYTSLLLHMDGTSGSTNFVDSGPNALAVTAVGNAQVSTTQSKFGGASAYFDGNGDYLTTPNSTLTDFGTGDFTIEAWSYGLGTIAGKWGSQVAWVLIANSTNITLGVGNSGTYSASLVFSSTISGTTWNHIAVTRSGTTVRCFLNGTQIGSSITNSANLAATATLDIGVTKSNLSSYMNGYIDDLRITKYARYQSSFTPPTSAFPNA